MTTKALRCSASDVLLATGSVLGARRSSPRLARLPREPAERRDRHLESILPAFVGRGGIPARATRLVPGLTATILAEASVGAVVLLSLLAALLA